MFSHNQKISPRQMKALLILDWLARACLMLPVCLAGRSLGTMVGCLVAGFLFWIVFSGLIARMSDDDHDFFELLAGRIGTVGAWIVYLAGFFYFLAYTAVCVNLCANLAAFYLLPEVPLPVLAALPLAAGLYLAGSTVEVQGRIGELTVPILLGLFLFMAAFDASGMELIPGEEHLLRLDERLSSGSYEVFACMGGMFLPILFPFLSEKKDTAVLIRRAACWSMIPAGALLFITAASFGTEGMFAFVFPTVRVMSNVTVPGGFFQRWDVFFLMLLLFSLAFSVGSGLWAMNEVIGCLWLEAVKMKWQIVSESGSNPVVGVWQEEYAGELTGFEQEQADEKSKNSDKEQILSESEQQQDIKWTTGLWIFRAITVFVIFCGAAGFRDPEAAINYYRAFNLYILTPFMILVYILLYFRGWLKKKQKAAVLFALCLLLTGCTARELEDRIFPMALELRMEGDHLMMTYAWNGEEASGSGGGGKGEEETKTNGEEMKNEKSEKSREEKENDGSEEERQAGNETEAGNGEGVFLQKEPVEQGNLTIFRGSTLAEIRQQVEEYSDRYMDYSHVKAVILDEMLDKYPELEREIYEWFTQEPAFAASLIIYPAQESGLSLSKVDERSDGKIGEYLENLYKNNQKLREMSSTLGEKMIMLRPSYANGNKNKAVQK